MRRVGIGRPEGIRWIPGAPNGTGVLVLAGSSGRIGADRARVLAEHGCVAESIRWFGGAGQNASAFEIPVETFSARVAALRAECDRIVLVGTSFGAEAALVCAALDPAVDAVVAFAPSDVVWAGYDGGRETSHWTSGGAPMPFVPFDWSADTGEMPPRYRPLYEAARARFPDRVATAAIAAERIPTVLLVAGGDDQVWPSVLHAEGIRARRNEHGRGSTVIVEPSAGHRAVLPGETPLPGGRMQRGGSPMADRALGAAAWPHLLALVGAVPA